MGVQPCAVTLEVSVEVSYKTNNRAIAQPGVGNPSVYVLFLLANE